MSATSWVETTLGEVAEIVGGATPKTSVDDYWGGDVYWATPKDLSGLQGAEIRATSRRLTQAGLRSCAARVLPPGSVLLSSRAPIGHVAINSVPMATNQGFKSLIPDRDRVDAKFLYWWLRRNRAALEAMGTGATFKEISKKTTAAVPIELPPIEEQRQIAAVLDAADELRAKRREALAKLGSLAQSIFIDMFGNVFDPSQFGASQVVLGELMAASRRSVDPRENPEQVFELFSIPSYDAGEAALTAGGDIGSAKPQLQPGDVLLSRIVPHIRRCWVVGASKGYPQVGSSEWIIFRGSDVVPEFLQTALLSDSFHPRFMQTVDGVGGSLLRARPSHVAEICISIPPKPQQEEFAHRAAAVRTSLGRFVSQSATLDDLFTSLQQRAFRGEL